MQLKSGDLYWPTTCPPARPGSSATRSITCDALVIGAGITGALVAHHLAETGAHVVIVDRRRAASGSTPASTALLQYEIDTSLVELRTKIGRDAADEAYGASFTALDDMARLVGGLDIECELRERRSLYLATSDADVEALQNESAERRAIGLPARYLARDELRQRFALAQPGAILSERALEVNPLKLTLALLERCARRGVETISATDVDLDGITACKAPYELKTATGHGIRAEWVIIATGYEAPEQFASIAQLTHMKSTFAVATDPIGVEPWPERALLWENADPYLYARTTADGRIIVGGEDETYRGTIPGDDVLAGKTDVLMRKLRTLVPHVDCAPAYSWTGVFAETDDGLPFIGAHPRWPNVLFALGYRGNGITFSLIAAQRLRDMVAGRASQSSGVFSFDRASSLDDLR